MTNSVLCVPVKVLNHVFNEWMNEYWLETAAKIFKKYIYLLHNEIELYEKLWFKSSDFFC